MLDRNYLENDMRDVSGMRRGEGSAGACAVFCLPLTEVHWDRSEFW
jgi:hypothetical protein